MSEQTVKAINRLDSSLSSMMKEQNKSLQSSIAPLKELPSMMQSQTESFVNSMSDNIRAQILVAMAQEKGKLSGSEQLVKEELSEIDQITLALEKKIHRIKNEKAQMLHEIEADAYKTIESFDASIFNLTRKTFRENIHLQMQNRIAPTFKMNKAIGSSSAENRTNWFNKIHSELDNGLNNYAKLLDESSEKASSLAYKTDDLKDTNVPIICIEYEEDGKRIEELIIAPQLNAQQETVSQLDWLKDKIDSFDQFFNHAFVEKYDISSISPDQLLSLSKQMTTEVDDQEVTEGEVSNEN